MPKNCTALVVIAAIAACALAMAQDVNVPLGGGDAGIAGLNLVATTGVKATLTEAPAVDDGKPAAKVAFKKVGEERRFIALAAQPKGDPTGAKALAIRSRVTLATGKSPRLAALIFDSEGGSWFKISTEAEVGGGFADARLSVTGLTKASFSESAAEAIPWSKLQKVWFGLVIDGEAEGTLEISRAVLTSEPYKPAQAFRVTGDGAGKWSVGQDPAVQSNLTTPDEGPDGKPCMKVEFTFPLGKHMYMIPSVPVPPGELEGYSGLRFTYRAALPPGVIGPGLLVTLAERSGAQYTVDAPDMPPARADWTTVTIPYTQFKLAGWSKDDNDHFDTDQIVSVSIGCHGSATGGDGKGTIMVRDVEFVP